MVTHKLHLHDNKMDGSCITTPSEAVNIALLPISFPSWNSPTALSAKEERCGRTYYWILNGGVIIVIAFGATLKPSRSKAVASRPPSRPPCQFSAQTQSQFPLNRATEAEEEEEQGGVTGLFGTLAFNIITFALWLPLERAEQTLPSNQLGS